MSCSRFKNRAHDYYLDHLDPKEVEALDRHAASCGECAEFKALCEETSCRAVIEALDDYVEDRLPPEKRAVFERHLAICSDCSNYLESYRRVIELSREAFAPPEESVVAPVPEALVQAILRLKQRPE